MSGGPDDERLMALIGEHLDEAEPLPPAADAIVAAAYAFRRLDDELAAVLRDVHAAADGMRGGEDRTIVFAHAGVSVEVHVEPDGEATGQLDPPEDATVTLYRRSPAGELAVEPVEVDELGRFVVPGTLTSFRLRVERPGAPPFATPWTVA